MRFVFMYRGLIGIPIIIFFFVYGVTGQELGGMPVNVAQHAQTFILFPSTITEFDISDKENFTCRPRRDNGLIIIPKSSENANATLVITEGNRTHMVLINYLANYDPNKHNLFYDLSNIKTLREYSKSYQQKLLPVSEPAVEKVNTVPDKSIPERTEQPKKDESTATPISVENEWQPLLDAADKAYSDKRYEAASIGYKEVLRMNPGNVHATNRLGVIEKILEILMDGEDQKIKQAEQTKKQFEDIVSRANGLYDGGKLEEAKILYQQAVKTLPTETFPKTRISLIDRTLEERRIQEEQANKAREAERLLTEKYNALIAKGEAALKIEQFDEAEKFFKEVFSLKPGDTYAKGRIADINNIKEAKAKATAEKMIQERAKAEAAKYTTQITKADKTFNLKDYKTARQQYTEALVIKPGDTYAQNRIDDIDNLLAAMAKAEKDKEAADLRLKLEKSYNSAIEKANAAFDKKEYADAISIYNYAIEIMPEEQFAKNRIIEIEKILNDIAKESELEKQRIAVAEANNKKYRDALAKADKAVNNKEWELANESYKEALTYKPEDGYAIQKMNWIKEETERIETERQQALKAEKDQKLKDSLAFVALQAAEEQAKKEEEYQNILNQGDAALKAGKYDDANASYLMAQQMMPGSNLAQEKINSLNELKEWLKQEELRKQMEEKEEANRRAYQEFINAGDKFFTDNEYNEAKASFEAALKIQPDAQYPSYRLIELEKAKAEEELRLSYKGPVTREMLKEQKVNIPLTQPQLYKAYPNISFGNPPPGQKLAADYFIVSDTLSNHNFSKEVLEKPMNIILSDSVENIAVHLSGIYFSGGNAFLRIRLENFSDKEFLAGFTTILLKTSDGMQIPYYPTYVTGFPYLLAGNFIDMVISVRAASIEDADNFTYTLSDRLNNITLKLTIPGNLYNSEFSHN
jgi:tetratricopeptide (TPR) repeat protein